MTKISFQQIFRTEVLKTAQITESGMKCSNAIDDIIDKADKCEKDIRPSRSHENVVTLSQRKRFFYSYFIHNLLIIHKLKRKRYSKVFQPTHVHAWRLFSMMSAMDGNDSVSVKQASKACRTSVICDIRGKGSSPICLSIRCEGLH